jgi:hypothetical protein
MVHVAELRQSSPGMQQCIQACLDCHSACLNTITHCLEQGEQHAEASHITLMMDCAEICQTTANFMLRHSPLQMRTCGICAEICQICAMDCQRFTGNAEMQVCVEMCRRCAESCQQMAQMELAAHQAF